MGTIGFNPPGILTGAVPKTAPSLRPTNPERLGERG